VVVPSRAGAPPRAGSVKVVFVKNESGEYRIEPEGSEFLARLRDADPAEAARFAVPGAKAAAAPPPAAAGARTAPSASAAGGGGAVAAEGGQAAGGAAESIPPEIDRLRQAAAAAEIKDDLGLQTAARFFKADEAAEYGLIDRVISQREIEQRQTGFSSNGGG
jgi:hypothetical protein